MIIKVRLTDDIVGTVGKDGKRPAFDVLGNPVPTRKAGAILNRYNLDAEHYVVLPNTPPEALQIEVIRDDGSSPLAGQAAELSPRTFGISPSEVESETFAKRTKKAGSGEN